MSKVKIASLVAGGVLAVGLLVMGAVNVEGIVTAFTSDDSILSLCQGYVDSHKVVIAP